MKRLIFAVGVLALGAAVVTPASADFAVIRFKDHHCQAWADSKVGPWPPGAQYLAVGLKSWDAATARGKWAMKHHRCKGWS
jgi:hypothetical protein